MADFQAEHGTDYSSSLIRKKLKPMPSAHTQSLNDTEKSSDISELRPLPSLLLNVVKMEASSTSEHDPDSAGGAKRMLVKGLNVEATLADELPVSRMSKKSFDDGLMQLRPNEIDDAVDRACMRLKEQFMADMDQLRKCFGVDKALSQ